MRRSAPFANQIMTSAERKRVAASLRGRSRIEAYEAANAIWQDSDLLLASSLISILKTGSRAFNRAAAAYAMQMVTTPKTIRALECTVENRAEWPKVRGEAAEALAHSHRPKTHSVLLKALADPSKDVRFWCAFALGQMGEKRALVLLHHLAVSDKRLVKGFHSVGKEAADAIENIRQNASHRQRRGCIFCLIS